MPSDCVFCKIVQNEISSKKVFEDTEIIAFHDIAPKAPVHVLVLPKQHVVSLNDADEAMLGKLLTRVKLLARELGLAERGYKVINNCGKEGGQIVQHLHFHLLGGAPLQGKGLV